MDAARALVAPRFIALLDATFAQHPSEVHADALLTTLVAFFRWACKADAADKVKDWLKCLDAVLHHGVDPSCAGIPTSPPEIITVLDLAHSDPLRARRPMWREAYRLMLPACAFSFFDDGRFMDRLAKEQRWLMRTPAAAIAAEPATRERLTAALPAVLWNRPPALDIVAKIRAYNAVGDGDMLARAVCYVHDQKPSDWTAAADLPLIVVAVIETGGDPLTQPPVTRARQCTPMGERLHAAQEEARARTLAVMMATHPRLGAQSLLAGWEPEMLAKFLAPACRGSVRVPPPSEAAAALRRGLWSASRFAASPLDAHGVEYARRFQAAVRAQSPPTPRLLQALALCAWRHSEETARRLKGLLKRHRAFPRGLALAPQTLAAAARAWPKVVREGVLRMRGPA